MGMVSAEGTPSASIFNDLNCQPDVRAHFDPQRVFPALSNLIVERDDGRFQIDPRCNMPRPVEMHAFAQLRAAFATSAPPSGSESCQSGLTASAIIQPGGRGRVGTIRILVEGAYRHGRSSASLPDGTVLVGSSRQPYLDAARVLIATGYDPDNWLEGWRPESTGFALRARLGMAAGLTVDETRTIFAPWKPFSPSAVSPSIRHSEIPATSTLAAPSLASLRLPPDHEEVERNQSAFTR